MSSPEVLAPGVLSGEGLLALDEDELVKFLNDCRASSNSFDISRVRGVDALSEGQRGELSEKLSAAAKKAGPFSADALSRRLDIVASHDKTHGAYSWRQSRQLRSPTLSPVPEGNIHYEACCRDELLKAGGRPMTSFDVLLDTLKDPRASREMLKPWLGDKELESREGYIPPAFSAQLKDWELFQHRWQWDHRGKYAGEEGFTGYMESRRKRWLNQGQTRVVSAPSFEYTTRRSWEYKKRYLELSEKEGFTAYMQAVKKRLASHNFTQPFQLAEDPRQQDTRTTWVEYLNYNYWWLDSHAAAMRDAEPRYGRAWDELERFNKALASDPSTTTGTLDERLDAATAQLETTMKQVQKFIEDTRTYRRREKVFRRQELRVEWVLEQLSLISAETSAECKATVSSSGRNIRKKKMTRDQPDIPTSQEPKKRKLEASSICSTLTPGPGTGKGSDITMSNKIMATSVTTSSGCRRSKRLCTGFATKEAQSSQIHSTGSGVRKRQRRKGA